MKPSARFISRSAGLLLAIYVLWRAVSEFYRYSPESGLIFGKFSPAWAAAFLTWTVVCIFLLVLCGFYLFSGGILTGINQQFANWRASWGWGRWVAAAMIVILPAIFLLWTQPGSYFETPMIRLVILFSSTIGVAVCVSREPSKLTGSVELIFGLCAAAASFYIARQLVGLSNYPFALGWSEGNRLYDYSLMLGSDRYIYNGEISNRIEKGRQLLWGLLFLLPGAPIWLHRLWGAILATVPSLLLGYALARWSRFAALKRWTLTFWLFLLLAQGPIYTPLILSALVVVLLVPGGRLLVSAGSAGLAGYYASLSRFTWLPAVPVWAGFILLADFDLNQAGGMSSGKSKQSALDFLRRLLPLSFVVFAGLAGGLLANPTLIMPGRLSSSTTFAQPLLWYRLFPNVTYPEGILGALILACAPLAALLVWQALGKRWKLNWLQSLAYLLASLIFLGGGLVASVKIGGGNNLHNLDMFLISLAILSALALRGREGLHVSGWPFFWRFVLALAVIIPAWSVYRSGTRLVLPPTEKQAQALEVLSNKVSEAILQGEVLFMDQRQLLTFGYIQDVALVPEYEKKFVMDQAMAGSLEYFDQFYADLENRRFAMIVSDPLFTKIKDSDYIFSEENNAWVQWVAEPLLCYYVPVRKIPNRVLEEFNIQLLVPRDNPQDCP
jgi:hypothetical protein